MLAVVIAIAVALSSSCQARALDAELLSRLYPRQAAVLTPLLQPINASETLREAAAKRGIYVGAAINYNYMRGNDSQYNATYIAQYNLATAESCCKFAHTQPEENQYNTTECRYIRDFVDSNDGAFRAHNLIWGTHNPGWLVNGSFSPSQLREILQYHVGNVSHMLGSTPYCWDVVNEAVTNDDNNGTFKNVDPWYPAVQDYVDLAFQTARLHAPKNVKLFYNDYGGEGLSNKSERIYQMVKSMKERGIPLDGVGLQMHVSIADYPPFEDVSKNIARLGALGLEVHITEMDVVCSKCNQTGYQLQAQIYQGMMNACLENAPVCKSFETWGFTDKYSWLNSKYTDPVPLPFAANYSKKPAYYSLLAALQH